MRLLAVWAVLMALVGVEFIAARVVWLRAINPAMGLGMAVLVALTFMRLGQGRGLVPVFALASLFWLGVMLGLGSLDSFTRHDVNVGQRTEAAEGL